MKRKQAPPLQLLKALYQYNPRTGIFTHKRNTGRGRKGCAAGLHRQDGHISISINGYSYLAHHLAWYYIYGTWPDEVDHEDRIRSNNRIKNLRDATRTQNNGNSNGWGYKKKSGLPRGVYKHPGDPSRFRAQIFINYKAVHLGCFNSIEEAKIAYRKAAKKHFGEFSGAK